MTVRVQTAPPQHHAFLYGRIGLHTTGNFFALEAVDDVGRIHGMVGFDNWSRAGADMHACFDTFAAARRLVSAGFRFLFLQAGRRIAHAHVRSDNAKSLSLVRTAGFREMHRSYGWHGEGVDDVLFELRREDCRFLGDAHHA